MTCTGERNMDRPFEDIEDLTNFLAESHITLEDCIHSLQEYPFKKSALTEEIVKLTKELNEGTYNELRLTELRGQNADNQILKIHGDLNLLHQQVFKEKRLKERTIDEFVELKGKLEEDTISAASKFLIQTQMDYKKQLEQKSMEMEPEKHEWASKISNLKEANASLDQETRTKIRSIRGYESKISEFKASQQQNQSHRKK